MGLSKNSLEAVKVFKEIVDQNSLTYLKFAERAGISKATIDAFVRGRPLTYKVLSAMVNSFPSESARLLAVAHLKDELYRAGLDPETFHISHRRTGVLLETIEMMLRDKPERMLQVANMIDNWRAEKSGRFEPVKNDNTRSI